MNEYNFITLSTHPEWGEQAARWFHEKWQIPLEEYLTSINESIQKNSRRNRSVSGSRSTLRRLHVRMVCNKRHG